MLKVLVWLSTLNNLLYVFIYSILTNLNSHCAGDEESLFPGASVSTSVLSRVNRILCRDMLIGEKIWRSRAQKILVKWGNPSRLHKS